MFSAGNKTIIVHTGDKYLLENAPLQKIGDWPGDHKKGPSCSYTFPFEVGVLYSQPYPGEPYSDQYGELVEGYNIEILDNFLSGEYDPSDYRYEYLEMNTDLLKKIFNLLIDDPRAPEDILNMLGQHLDS